MKYSHYVLLLSLSFFLFLELYVRYQFPHVELLVLTGKQAGVRPMGGWAVGDAYGAFRPQPGTYQTRIYKGTNNEKIVNSFGFISTPELTYEKPEKTIRIAFFGGSSTAGTGVILPDEETWPFKTVEILKDSLPSLKIDFINVGASGYSSFESYGRFWSKIRFFKPDIILVNHAWNELYYFAKADSMLGWRTDKDGEWSLRKKRYYKVTVYEPMAIDWFISWSQLFSRVRLKFTDPISGEIGRKSRRDELKSSYIDAPVLGVKPEFN